MSDTKITQKDIDEILRLIQSAEHVADFRIKYGDLELNMSRTGAVSAPVAAMQGAAPLADPSPPAAEPRPGAEQKSSLDRVPADPIPPGMAAVKAPMVGTFYRAPSPGAKPFVEVGTAVEPDTVVGIIEVMKLMNSLSAGVAGTVKQILVEDSKPVGFGQVLVLIDPVA